MKLSNFQFLLLVGLSSAIFAAEPKDWRLQLLEQEGLTLEEAADDFLGDDVAISEARFIELTGLLSSEDFATRENSQKAIQRMGLAAKPWLDRLPEQDDPEIEFRLTEIRKNLSSRRQWETSELLRYAVKSLVGEKNQVEPDLKEPLMFVELFHDPAVTLDDGYRHFNFAHDQGLKGKVTDGVLRLSGKNAQIGDQRLIIESININGKKTLPDKFRIEASLKGTPGGEGGYHIGISVGKVRALFHPGYSGGGFRFEEVGTEEKFTDNTDMGFTPKSDVFSTMGMDVERLPDKSVKLTVNITQEGNKIHFQKIIKISAEEIGELDSISLDRSGQPGGDAIFDNLVIEMSRD